MVLEERARGAPQFLLFLREHELHRIRSRRPSARASAFFSSSCTTPPISSGSKRAPLSYSGPVRQPSASESLPPAISKVQPVTPFDSALASQTTSGDTFAGSIASKPDSGAFIMSAKTPSVMRVRADGAIAFEVIP